MYFGLVFGAGFVLGTLRVTLAAPRLGERVAELVEAPIMLLVTIVAAGWIVRRLALPRGLQRLGMGLVGLGLLLGAELAVVLLIRGVTLGQYVASRDPVSGAVYLALLGAFAFVPLLVGRR
jgi:hypothetical protein